ncbi:oligosaccharide flippase family protein [uncultured Pseudodesulfovibrio sp.]|uniref:oligosaccharide flippase family protein n=1 Tax=uncultured Pseudodesulfovibrio sp. TaxID=2035858 RepID=UPI0029C6C75B|nr:oligosaccharide flippase family protein [uncultured Pseudodesulfovibrio sp.]
MINVHKLLARNTLATFVKHFVNLGILFYLTPFTISAIGNLQYGLWAVVLTVAGYSGLLDMGITTATTKLAAEYRSRDKSDKLNELISSSISLFTFFGFICLVLIMIFMPGYIASINHEALGTESPVVISALIGIDIFFVFIANIFTGIILSFHQFHIKSLIDIIVGLLRLFATIVVLNAGYGLLGLAFIKLSTSVISSSALYFVFKKQMPSYKIKIKRPAPGEVRSLVSLGGKLFYMTLAVRLSNMTSPIIVASTIGSVWNAYYAIVERLATYGNEIVYAVTAAFMPVFSELFAQDEDEMVGRLYLQYTRYVISLSMPMFIGVVVLGPEFIGVWINHDYMVKGGTALRFLASSFAIIGLQPLLGRLVIGSGRVGFYTTTVSVGIVLNILISIPICYYLGITGLAALSTLFSTFFFVVFTIHLSKAYNISIKNQIVDCYLRMVPPIAAFLIAYKLMGNMPMADSYFAVFTKAVILVAVYVPVAFVSVLNSKERAKIFQVISLRVLKS